MPLSSERPGYTARMSTDYVNTTGKCLELFYWINQRLASDVDEKKRNVIDTKVEIVVIDEELFETTVFQSVGWDYIDFRRAFVELPDGFNRIAINGKRSMSRVNCGISIDDVTIMGCDRFGEELRSSSFVNFCS